MRILLATYWAVPHVGGVWPFMVQLQKRLEAMGHEVDLMGNGNDPGSNFISIVNKDEILNKDKLLPLLYEKLKRASFPAIHRNTLIQYTEFQRYIFELAAAYFNIEQYDVIHTQDVLATGCIARVRKGKTALVASLHGCVAHEVRHQLTTIHKSSTAHLARDYYNSLEHFGAEASEVTIVANDWLKNILTTEFHVSEERIRKFQYGYDRNTFMERMKAQSSIQRPTGKKVIIYAGRLTEQKGVHDLISSLEKLKKARNDWVCWIVGEGEKQEELKNQSKAAGLEQDIDFLGSRDDVPHLLGISDIFVLPSTLDNQPLSVIEAQIAGKPIIVSDAGGLPEMVEHGVTGLVTPKGDTDALCNSINLLLSDEEYRNTLGSNAKQWSVTHWDLDTMVYRFIDAYKYAIAKRRQGQA